MSLSLSASIDFFSVLSFCNLFLLGCAVTDIFLIIKSLSLASLLFKTINQCSVTQNQYLGTAPPFKGALRKPLLQISLVKEKEKPILFQVPCPRHQRLHCRNSLSFLNSTFIAIPVVKAAGDVETLLELMMQKQCMMFSYDY